MKPDARTIPSTVATFNLTGMGEIKKKSYGRVKAISPLHPPPSNKNLIITYPPVLVCDIVCT